MLSSTMQSERKKKKKEKEFTDMKQACPKKAEVSNQIS